MHRGGDGEPWEGRHGKLTTSHSTRGSFKPRHHWPAQCHTTSIIGPAPSFFGEASARSACGGRDAATAATAARIARARYTMAAWRYPAYHVLHAWQGRLRIATAPQLRAARRRAAAAPSFFGKHSFSIRMFVSSEMRT